MLRCCMFSTVAGANLKIVDLSSCNSVGGIEAVMRLLAISCPRVAEINVSQRYRSWAALCALACRAQAIFASPLEFYERMIIKGGRCPYAELCDLLSSKPTLSTLQMIDPDFAVDEDLSGEHEKFRPQSPYNESFGYDSFASESDSEAETAREYYKAKHVLFTAVKHGNTWVVALLLSVKFPEEGAFKKCLEAVDCHGRGALNLAAALGDVSSASLLLRAGMHPRHDKRRNQPLLVACEVGSFDFAKLMVDAGSDVNAANNQV
jgi:hypothetical protein